MRIRELEYTDLIHGRTLLYHDGEFYLLSCVHGQDWVSYYNVISLLDGGRFLHTAKTLDDVYESIKGKFKYVEGAIITCS
jgi:hypothetical protein